MANTATLVSATPNRCTYLLTGDGTVAGPTITNATLLTDMVNGPLQDAYNQTYATDGTSIQSAMRKALLGGAFIGTGVSSLGTAAGPSYAGGCVIEIQLVATGTDTTAQVCQVVADVDVDAVSVTKPEINIGMSDTTGQLAYMHLVHLHTATR